MLISCGAALVNLALAVRHLGFAADVRVLPDVTRRDLLAEVRWGWHKPPAAYEDALYRSIMRRHTHRGPFTVSVPPFVTGELVRIARQEQAELHVIYDTGRYQALADLVRAAERSECASPQIAAEQARWAQVPGDTRCDGVPIGTRHGAARHNSGISTRRKQLVARHGRARKCQVDDGRSDQSEGDEHPGRDRPSQAEDLGDGRDLGRTAYQPARRRTTRPGQV